MRRPSLWIFIALALGASTAWLAVELHAARRELAESRATLASVTPGPVVPATLARSRFSEAAPQPPATSPAPEQAGRPRDDGRAQAAASERASILLHNAWVRTWLDDPEKRAKVLADSRKGHEREIPRKLLDLDDREQDQLMDALAASGLRYAEAMYRCNTDAACDLQAAVESQRQADRLELVALLGPEKARRLETWRDNYMERASVTTFRSGLPESMSMSDAQAEKLADALGDERRRLVKEWELRGDRVGGMANMWGSLNFPDTPDLERRAREATEFQRRQRERATEVLTSGQLEIFSKQQDQLLEIALGSWESADQSGQRR